MTTVTVNNAAAAMDHEHDAPDHHQRALRRHEAMVEFSCEIADALIHLCQILQCKAKPRDTRTELRCAEEQVRGHIDKLNAVLAARI